MKKLAVVGFLFPLSIAVYSQDYLIHFTSTDDSTSVESIKAENLTQGTSLTINGTDILNLKAVLTGINSVYKPSQESLKVYPNPATEYTTIEFATTAPGNALIAIYDQVGKTKVQMGTSLAKGTHTYQINGLSSGVYAVRVVSETYSYTGKIISLQKGTAIAGITRIGFCEGSKNESKLKSANTTIQMQYTAGDRLKFTGISGNYSTILTDIPTESKTIAFEFTACTDSDNNNYPVVKIGTQKWMAENLKTTKYNTGSDIPNVTDATEWSALTTPAYSWYENDEVTYKNTYGALYNWQTVNTGNLCPSGWHDPADDDWTTLENYLIVNGYNYDGTTTENKIAKALASASGWSSSSGSGTVGNTDYLAIRNATGFTALPGGYRLSNGSFGFVGDYGFWWSSTGIDATSAYYRGLYNFYSNVYKDYGNKGFGFSVRCIRDENGIAPVVAFAASKTSISEAESIAFTDQSTNNPTSWIWDFGDGETSAEQSPSHTYSSAGTFTVSLTATNSYGSGSETKTNYITVTEGTAITTVTDFDGNVYNTVAIGIQTWMKENLKTTHYSNGAAIPLVTGTGNWEALMDTSKAFCWYGDEISNKETYGALYTWAAAMNDTSSSSANPSGIQGVCPVGWHLPSHEEWWQLTEFLGGESVAGGKLKETSTAHWYSPNTGATNETGYTALPGGQRGSDGTFQTINYYGNWWSATEYDTGSAMNRRIFHGDGNVYIIIDSKEVGFSVRCLKD
jgi:uncharacterized protein (TIGR02145 family)